MAIKISGSTIIDDGRQLVNVGVSTISALNVSGNINANGNIIGDNSTNISGISSVTATSYFGNGENLTGVGFKPDADENLFAGTDAGSNLDGTSG